MSDQEKLQRIYNDTILSANNMGVWVKVDKLRFLWVMKLADECLLRRRVEVKQTTEGLGSSAA